MSISGVDASTQSSQNSVASKTLSENFDTFLTLLTAQLQNQDPLSPVDSTKFTEQLVAYSQVEQQIATNTKLDQLLGAQQTASSNAALSFIGRTATIADPTAELSGGAAVWGYELDQAAASVKLTILDSSGKTVATKIGETDKGLNVLTWDGVGADGKTRDSGQYTLKVEALDSNGKAISSRVTTEEQILGVDFSQSQPRYVTSSGAHEFEDLLALR